MDHQCKENGARNMYSKYNQMKAVLNALQINKKYTLSTFPSSNRRNFEDFGKVLATSVFELYQSIAVQLYQPTHIRWSELLYVYM